MSESRHSSASFSLHRRHMQRGCMPVALLLAVAFMVGMAVLVKVEMQAPLRPAGEGNVLYRKDELLETQIRQRSPLPLRLPRYIAPLRQDEGVVSLPLRRTLKAAEAPEELPFPPAADSVVLNVTSLLELPPVKGEGEGNEAVPAGERPVEAEPLPAGGAAPEPLEPEEPASAALQGKEVA